MNWDSLKHADSFKVLRVLSRIFCPGMARKKIFEAFLGVRGHASQDNFEHKIAFLDISNLH